MFGSLLPCTSVPVEVDILITKVPRRVGLEKLLCRVVSRVISWSRGGFCFRFVKLFFRNNIKRSPGRHVASGLGTIIMVDLVSRYCVGDNNKESIRSIVRVKYSFIPTCQSQRTSNVPFVVSFTMRSRQEWLLSAGDVHKHATASTMLVK